MARMQNARICVRFHSKQMKRDRMSHRDILPSDLTVEIMVATSDSVPATTDQLTRQIALLDEAIDRATDPTHRDFLCAQFQALNWARAPKYFAPPCE